MAPRSGPEFSENKNPPARRPTKRKRDRGPFSFRGRLLSLVRSLEDMLGSHEVHVTSQCIYKTRTILVCYMNGKMCQLVPGEIIHDHYFIFFIFYDEKLCFIFINNCFASFSCPLFFSVSPPQIKSVVPQALM